MDYGSDPPYYWNYPDYCSVLQLVFICDACCQIIGNPRASSADQVMFGRYASAQNSTEAKGFRM